MFDWEASHTVEVLFFVCYAQLYALLLVWAGLGKSSYVWRYGAVLAWLGVWLPAEVDDLGWLSLVQAAVVLPMLEIVRRRRKRAGVLEAGRLTFGLRDLFLAALLGGSGLAIVLRLPSDREWHLVASCGAMLGALTLASAWLALGQRRFWWRFFVFAAVSGSVWFAWRYVDYFRDLVQYVFLTFFEDVPAASMVSLLVYGVFGWLVLMLTLDRVARRSASRSQVAKAALALGLLMPLFMATWHYAFLAVPLTVPRETYPNPNAYDSISSLASQWKDLIVPHEERHGKATCLAFRDEHRDELLAVRAALAHEGKVRVMFKKNAVIDRLEDNVVMVGGALRLLAIDASPRERVELGVDLMKYAGAISNGGMYIDYLQGYVMEDSAMRMVAAAARELDASECRELILRVTSFESNREPFERVSERDFVWCLSSDGWHARSAWAADRLIGVDSAQEAREALRRAGVRRIAYLRLLQAELAIQAYRKESGEWPTDLESLVPSMLDAVPIDPFADAPLRYRVEGDTYELYSVAYNRVDDGGVPADANSESATGDLLFNPTPEENDSNASDQPPAM